MSRLFEKTINKIKRIDALTRIKATGSPIEFAEKLDISPSTLYQYILVMKKTLQVPISYCKVRRSYYYREHGKLSMEFKKES
jgi:response regulator of citrate/malate metabolism